MDLKNAGINTIQVSLDGNNTFLHENMRLISGAFKKAIEAGRSAYLSGFGRTLDKGASASSPLTGFLHD